MNVNQAAFCTVTSLAVATIGLSVYAATTASTAATVAAAALALVAGAFGIASMTAYADDSSLDAKSYFANVQNHAGRIVPVVFQFVAQTFLVSLVEGIGKGISTLFYRKITGTQPEHS